VQVISLAPNHRSFFVRCDPDTTAFAPHLKLSVCVFDFRCFHCSFRFPLVYPPSFESARRSPRCNPPDVCIRPPGKSTQVFRWTEVGLLSFLRSGQERTKWACGISGSERRDTTACRPWAIEKYSTSLTPIRNAAAFAVARRRGVDSDLSHDSLNQTLRHIDETHYTQPAS
jgi:hypothetical protein